MRKRFRAGENQARPDVRCLVGCALALRRRWSYKARLGGASAARRTPSARVSLVARKPKGNRFFKVQDEKVKGNKRMAIERTLSIIKPDATERNLTGKINTFFEDSGLRIVAQKRIRLTLAQAEGFYAAHRERAFFDELAQYMISAPVVAQVLEGEDAIAKNREIMGATNPANANEGTIRKTYGLNVQENSVHGSDSPENAATEIAYFFGQCEIVG